MRLSRLGFFIIGTTPPPKGPACPSCGRPLTAVGEELDGICWSCKDTEKDPR